MNTARRSFTTYRPTNEHHPRERRDIPAFDIAHVSTSPGIFRRTEEENESALIAIGCRSRKPLVGDGTEARHQVTLADLDEIEAAAEVRDVMAASIDKHDR